MPNKRLNNVKIVVMITGLFCSSGFLGCSSGKEKNQVNMVGGLEIHTVIERNVSWAWFTNGGSPSGKISTSYFSIKYKGKTVLMPGQKDSFYFWQAFILQDAPKPTILAASQSIYLISEENGNVKAVAVNEQNNNFGKFQWLDSENGKPGKQYEVYIKDDSRSSRDLSGGRYLLVNSNTILDVHSLQSYNIDINSYERVTALDNYNAFDSRAVSFSPDKTQIIYIGYRRNPTNNQSEYALVSINLFDNTAYVIPYDRTDTHLYSIWDATNLWVDTYFEWTNNKEGKQILALRKFNQLPYWQGRWGLEVPSGLIKNYTLVPIEKTMTGTFMDFVKQEYEVSNIKTKEISTQVITSFTIKNINLIHYYNSAHKSATLESENKELIKEIGERFEIELKKGKFQKDFSRFNFD